MELLKKSYPLPLTIGKTDQVNLGKFNLINPSCYQYPEENGCKPGDLIKADDQENFDHFKQGLAVSWKLSEAQRIADQISLITFIFILGMILFTFLRRKIV